MEHRAYCRSNRGTESSVEGESGGQTLPDQINFNPPRHRTTSRVNMEDDTVRLGGLRETLMVEKGIRPFLIMDARCPIITVMLLRELSHNSRV